MLGEVQADSPALQAPSSCFCPPPSPPSPPEQSFQTFFSSSSPDKQRISVENSRCVEHLGTPFIRLGPLWPTHNPFSLTIHYFSDILEFTLLCVCVLLWWQAYQPYTTWRGARNRSNPKCVKLLRAQDPVIPELLPRWQVLAPMAPAQPRYAGAREGQQGQLRAITSLPCSPMNLNLASSSSCNCVPLSNNKQVRPHGMSRNARLSSLQTMSLSLMRTSIKFHTCYSSLSPRSIL